MTRSKVNFAGIDFKNPVVLASGTCGFGKELNDYFNIELLGGLCSKGLTIKPRAGNNGLRIFETPSGIMNSVGLENPGVKSFIENEISRLNNLDLVNIVNVGGHSIDDYLQAIELLNNVNLDIIELNISCPNVKAGGMNFGVKCDIASQVLKEVRKICKHKLMVKLSPNAENIVDIAKVCEDEGADAISLVNTFLSMAVDIRNRKAVFENIYAGLSGPAIKPIALRMAHQVSKNVSIPVMAMGGITSWEDAIEYLMVGAKCIQVGTSTFMKPNIAIDIINGIEKYLEDNNVKNISEIIGII